MITLMIRTKADVMLNSIMLTSFGDAREALLSGDAILTKTYSKLYYKGGGWYAVSGYAADGSDVHKLVNQINDLNTANAVLKEGGYYFDKKGEICGTYADFSKWIAINKAIQRSPLTGGKRMKVNIEQREYHGGI
jgi:hypothetical protein